MKVVCGKTGEDDGNNDLYDFDDERMLYDVSEDDGASRPFYWSAMLQESFREEIEKYVWAVTQVVVANHYFEPQTCNSRWAFLIFLDI